MSKKNKKSEAAEPLSKKQRKALEKREAQLAAELAEREAEQKAQAKAAKKLAKLQREELRTEGQTHLSEITTGDYTSPPFDDLAPDPLLGPRSRRAIATETTADEFNDRAIKARVGAKKAARDALDALDRTDPDAVKAFNEVHGSTIGHFATSADELEAVSRWLRGEDKAPAPIEEAVTITMVDGVDVNAPARGEDKAPFVVATTIHISPAQREADRLLFEDGDLAKQISDRLIERERAAQVADEVETEQGRVFEVGAPHPASSDLLEIYEAERAKDKALAERGFVLPSDAKPEVEVGRNGYKIKGPDGKERQYTRITTFIKLIEDKTNLERWTKRKLMEGIIADQTPGEDGAVTDRLGQIRDILHNRDVAIAKARKADRKGKLAPGELATLIEEAEKAAKSPIDSIVTELEELGGSKVAATKGTDIHALCELYDEKGIDAVGDLLSAGTITPADLADVEAYARAIDAAGIKMLRSEVMVVNDEMKRAGRLDRIGMVRFPGTARAVRCVLDIKTGSVEYGISIPLQLENYAGMQGYDPERPDQREDLKLSRTKAVVIHLPQGKAECHIYPVDLTIGRLGNRITQEARDFRNAGKKGIDFTVDLATGVALQTGAES